MKRKITAFVLVLVMLCAFVFTSCNNNDTDIVDQTEVRRALTVTLYCITDEQTTADAIKRVQDEINKITRKRFSTQVILRFFTEDKYNEVIDNLVADIALEQSENEAAASESAAAAKESKRIAAIDKLISLDKAEVTTRSLIVWSTETGEEDATEEETYETEKNIFDEDVEKYPEASDTQLDIFLICGTDNLNKYVLDEKYATDGEPFLVPLDESLSLSSKALKQYINENVLLAGKVGNVQYAIPTNKQIAGDSTYLVLDRALMTKYGYTSDDIRNLTSAKFVTYLNDLKENESDVVPLLNAPDAPGIVSLFDEASIFGAYVANTAVTGFKAVPKNLLSAYQFTDHFIYMEQYKRNGYIQENPAEDARWGAAVVTASEDEIAEYDEDKYVVKLLGKGIATSESIGQYMFGVSKYTRDSSRCIELITYLNTNPEFRNLLQYGIEGYNYKIDPDTKKLERLNHEYMMDIFSTGNTFIAYPEEYMELDVWEKAKESNKNAVVSPYLGFIFEKSSNEELIARMKELSAKILEDINAFDVETQRLEEIEKLKKTLEENHKDMQFYQEQLDVVAERALAYIEQIAAAQEELVPYADNLSKIKAEISPYDTAITQYTNRISALSNQIKDEEAVKATDEEPDLAPDLEKIDSWKKEIEELELDIREQRGYSYELRKQMAEAQAEYDVYNKVVTDLQTAYKDEKVIVVDEETGAEKEYSLQSSYEARKSNLEKFTKDVEDTEAAIEAMNTPSKAYLTSKYNELKSAIDEYTARSEQLTKETADLNVASKPYNEAVTAATAELSAARKVLEEKAEAFAEYRRNNAIKLSYVEDIENSIAAEKSEDKIAELETELAKARIEYDAEVRKGAAQQKAYDDAAAAVEAAENTVEAAKNAPVLLEAAAKNAEKTENDSALRKAQSELDSLMTEPYQYYDAIASKLYTEYFKKVVSDLEKDNADYQIFMNIGEQADNENGVVAIYNEWYSSMYGD